MRAARLALIALAACCALAPGARAAATDALDAMNVVPPGESGLTTLPSFVAVTAGLSNSYGPFIDDQLSLYANWQYKPMQFEGEGQGTPPPGDAQVKIWRDPQSGVPTITGATDADVFFGVGYAMAQDRLFQMEAFRHVGHGTLAELVGPSGLAMDEQVRRVTEGSAALRAEFDALPGDERARLQRFVDGINAYITQIGSNPAVAPAEFTLLGDLPIKQWTVLDAIGFGEYAGRFFGEFGHGDIANAVAYDGLVQRFGAARAETLFNDLLPLDDPRAPTSIAAADGRFPRHAGHAVRTSYRGSVYANHAPADRSAIASIASAARAIDRQQALVHSVQRRLALPRFGSNAIVVAGRLARNRHPMLYGGPQTGWAVPGFFWEAELHSPLRDERGVMVPALPLMVIGRNARAAWTVTSALDANADTFVDRLDASRATYLHDGRRLRVEKRTETLRCTNPPTAVLPLLSGKGPTLCPPAKTITVYRTVHGPALADPDAEGRLYTRESVVDHHLLQSFGAWDLAGRQTDVHRFGAALARVTLGFNFFYADARHIGYWHVGSYPIRPRNADPRLPLPGDGRYDWQGLERFSNQPHVIDPRAGYVVNWNNKPSVGWWSKNLETGGEGGIWGDGWESAALGADVKHHAPYSLARLGQVPRDVAYIDNRARYLKRYFVTALRGATDPQLVAIRNYLRAWNNRRDGVAAGGRYSTPAVVIFDRLVENAMRDAEDPILGARWYGYAGLSCATCTLTSIDNLSAPTYKFEYAGEQLLLAILRGRTGSRWVASRGALLVRAARETAAALARTQGSDPAKWNEPVEQGAFSPQGALSVPPLVPLPNRGSYGQVVATGG